MLQHGAGHRLCAYMPTQLRVCIMWMICSMAAVSSRGRGRGVNQAAWARSSKLVFESLENTKCSLPAFAAVPWGDCGSPMAISACVPANEV